MDFAKNPLFVVASVLLAADGVRRIVKSLKGSPYPHNLVFFEMIPIVIVGVAFYPH